MASLILEKKEINKIHDISGIAVLVDQLIAKTCLIHA